MSRSELFPGFLGNSRVTQSLFNSIQAGKLVHLLLFTGAPGSGKKTLAQNVVQMLFCPELCRECKNCAMLAKRIHPDLYLVEPEGGSIKLEQSRDLKIFLSSAPNTAPYKVAILADCQLLTVEAGNTLLKILEEPPSRSLCILTADTQENVLPTLVSRSQSYNLAPLANPTLLKALAQRVPKEHVALLAGFSEGILGKALTLYEDPDFWQQRRNFVMEIKEILAARRDPLLTSESWYPLSERFFDLLEFWLRDMLMLQTVKVHTPTNFDMMSELAECISVCPRDKTIVLLEECVQARERLRARCNPHLVFDGLLLKMWEV